MSATSTWDLFHNIWLACYSNINYFLWQCDCGWIQISIQIWVQKLCKKDKYSIKGKPITSHNHSCTSNATIEWIHNFVNDIPRSFDLENNHENLEEKEDNPFDCSFSQLHGLSEAQNCNHHLATPCLISIFIELLIFMLRSQFNGITSWCVCFSHYLYWIEIKIKQVIIKG
jgi:hypothetical protein